MNAEIYSLRKKRKDSVELKNALPEIISSLHSKDIRLLYKTELDYNYKKILECLEQTLKGDDEIDTVFLINGLGKTDCNPVMLAFEQICELVDPLPCENKEELSYISEDGQEIKPKKLTRAEKKAEKERRKKQVLELYSLGEMGNGYSACFTYYKGIRLVALPRSEDSGLSTKEMILLCAERMENSALVPNIAEEEKTENGYAYFKYKKVNNSVFNWRNYIPVRSDDAKEVVRKIVFMAAAITVFVTAGMIINEKIINPSKVEGDFNDLRGLYYNTDTDLSQTVSVASDIEGGKLDDSVLPSFRSLVAINDEVQGWIYIPNTRYIDYPVMYSTSDGPGYQKYLYRDYAGNYSDYGCVFIDYRSIGGTDAKNVILHGHNMDNGMMFHDICNYKSVDFYRSTPTFTFNSRDEESEWVVFAAFATNTLSEHGTFFNYLRGSFANDSEFMNFVYQCRARSLIDTPVTVNEDDQIITLSTCSYEYKNFRTVVMARKVRPYEKTNGFSFNTSYASYASNPIKPAVYYRANGGSPPSITTFEKALKAGRVPWYDGDGVLNGQEIDPGIFFVNDDPDPNEVASSTPTSSSSSSSSSEESSSSPSDSYEPDDGYSSEIPDDGSSSEPDDWGDGTVSEDTPVDSEPPEDIPIEDPVVSEPVVSDIVPDEPPADGGGDSGEAPPDDGGDSGEIPEEP